MAILIPHGHEISFVTHEHSYSCSELVILLIPINVFSNKISEACRNMVQSHLVSVQNNL